MTRPRPFSSQSVARLSRDFTTAEPLAMFAEMRRVREKLGFTQDAEDLLRSGQAYAAVIDHPALWAHLLRMAAGLCFWDGPAT